MKYQSESPLALAVTLEIRGINPPLKQAQKQEVK